MVERRSIATKWTCQREGSCCQQDAITVTLQEFAAMQAARPASMRIQHLPGNFLRIDTAHGCAYLERSLDGRASCAIYESRPFNCRRFQCLRPDVTVEPFEPTGPLGCQNLSDRLDQSLHALTFYQANQRRAQPWAVAHGWSR